MAWTTPATPVGGTPITVSFYNTNIRDNLSDLDSRVGAAVFTTGMIMFWNQSGSIPSGWAELTAARNRFIIGANDTYAFDATGGSATINPQHSHNITNGPTTTATTHDNGGSADDVADQDHSHSNTEPSSSTSQSVLNPYIAKTAIVKS